MSHRKDTPVHLTAALTAVSLILASAGVLISLHILAAITHPFV